MGKSDARIGFEKTYPDAFGTGNHPNALQVTKVFIDAIQILRGGLNTASYATLNELAQGFLRYTIHQILERHPYADTFYFVFDYYPFVPLAKAVEQQKRRKKKQEEWVFDFDPQAEISEHWSVMLNDRNYGVPEILRAFTRIWIEDPPTDLGTILIDGHYLEEVNGLNVLNVPLYVSPQLKPAPELQNFWGEGDMKIPFLLKKVAADMSADEEIVVISVDTDMMMILTILAQEVPQSISWRYGPKPSNAVNSHGRGRIEDTQKWCYISKLLLQLKLDAELKDFADPVKALALVIAASGGDYTDPIPRVPIPHWLKTLRANANHFRKIIDEDWQINNDLHRELMLCACKQSSMRKEIYKHIKGTDPGHHRMPSLCDTLHRRRHLQFVMNMLRHTGRDRGPQDNPLLFGYQRIDRTREVSHDNISRCHDTDPPDDLNEGVFVNYGFNPAEEIEKGILSPPSDCVDLT